MLFIYCAGGFGKEVRDIALRTGLLDSSILFIDDARHHESEDIISFEHFKRIRVDSDQVIIAHGEPCVRAKIYERLTPLDLPFATLIDPSSSVSPSAHIAPGVVICPLCVISCETSISENVLVNTMSIVGHDCSIGTHSVISSMVNLGGACVVKKQVYVGMGSLVRESLTLDDHCVVSMGSVVHRDVPSRHIVQGDPARSRMLNEDGKIFKR